MTLQSKWISADHNVAEVFSEVWNSGKITDSERLALQTAFLKGEMSSDSYMAVDRMLHAVKRGWLNIKS